MKTWVDWAEADAACEALAKWYFSSFVTHRAVSEAVPDLRWREYQIIFTAENSSAAYDRSIEMAAEKIAALNLSEVADWVFDGISQLLLVYEPPAADSELVWLPQELRPHELEAWMDMGNELQQRRAPFALSQPTHWYMAELVEAEIHDTGSHGDTILVWTNSHLIAAEDDVAARRAAIDLGTAAATDVGSHRCDGDTAHFEFQGVRDLRPTIEPPYDGATLWFDESANDLSAWVPPRSELGVFEWEARQRAARDS